MDSKKFSRHEIVFPKHWEAAIKKAVEATNQIPMTLIEVKKIWIDEKATGLNLLFIFDATEKDTMMLGINIGIELQKEGI